jgi:hypothetical protein
VGPDREARQWLRGQPERAEPPLDGVGLGHCQWSPKEPLGSPIWSLGGDVTGPLAFRLAPVLQSSVGGRARAAACDPLLGVLGPDARASDLHEMSPVGRPAGT